MSIRRILHRLFRLLYRLLSRVEVSGLENIPAGGAILCPNHVGILDAPLLFALVERQDLTALAAKKHQRNPILRWLIEGAGGIWLNRDEPDAHAIRAARDYLQRGGLLGIAPEGTRSPTGALMRAKTGAAYLADKAGVPVVPIAITGTRHGLRKILTLQRPRLKVVFGAPFSLPPIPRAERDAGLQRNTDEIMCRIAVLLPPEYRGVYAEHPRLLELLGQQTRQPGEAAASLPPKSDRR